MNIDVSVASAFAAGLVSFVSPCVLPLVPSYLCFLTGISLSQLTTPGVTAPARTAVMTAALAFILGFITVFVAMGASASSLGMFVARYFEWLALLSGGLIIAMGLHFLGVARIGLMYREARFQTPSAPTGLAGAYIMGLAFAFGWTPCIGPVLASILLVAGAQASAAHGTLLLGAYGLGIGVPFALAALFAGSFMALLQRFRPYLGVMEKLSGLALVATGTLFIAGGIPQISAWLLQTFPALGTIG